MQSVAHELNIEGSWNNVLLEVFIQIYHACVALDQSTIGCPRPNLRLHLTCKNWRKQAGSIITKLTLSVQGPARLCSALTNYPHLQSLHLHRVSLYFSQFEDIGKLPNLRRLSLVHLNSVETEDHLLLQWQRGYRRSAFQFLQKLTSLELGAHRQAPVTSEEYQGLSHLTDLQHITLQQRPFPAPTSGYIPCDITRKLSALTSLEVDGIERGIYRMTRLQSLSILPSGRFEFTEIFSSLQRLTAFAVGPNPARQDRTDPVMVLGDLLSLKVFSSLQELTLIGIMGVPVDNDTEQTTLRSLWEGLATFTSVKHLEVGDILHTKDAFTSLAKMTQLTCLDLSFKSQHVQVDILDEQLAALSTLNTLITLRCIFPAMYALVWSFQDQKSVAGPMPTVGFTLKAALPQAVSMSAFAIKLKWQGCTYDVGPGDM